MNPLFFHCEENPEMYRAICSYVGHLVWGEDRGFTDGCAMGVFEENALVCGIIYHNFDPWAQTVEISGAGTNPRWLTKPVLWEMFNYPFNRLGCQAVFMRVDEGDKRLKRILTAYRFSRHVLPHLRGKGKSECVYILSEDDWRANGFHKENENVEAETNAAA